MTAAPTVLFIITYHTFQLSRFMHLDTRKRILRLQRTHKVKWIDTSWNTVIRFTFIWIDTYESIKNKTNIFLMSMDLRNTHYAFENLW